MTAAWRRLGQSPWLFAGPAVAAAVIFVWLPMVSTLGLSFFDWSLLRQEGTWRGLDHYRGTLANPDFHLALVNTGLYLLALLPLQVGVPQSCGSGCSIPQSASSIRSPVRLACRRSAG